MGDVLEDALAQLAGQRRPLQPRQFTAQFDALHCSGHKYDAPGACGLARGARDHCCRISNAQPDIYSVPHFALASFLGAFFAVLMGAFRLTSLGVYARAGVLLGSGIIYGNLIFGISEFLALPIFDRALVRRVPLVDFGAVHVVFGAVLGW